MNIWVDADARHKGDFASSCGATSRAGDTRRQSSAIYSALSFNSAPQSLMGYGYGVSKKLQKLAAGILTITAENF